MKQLRAIRILMAALFFAACVVCLVIGPHVHPMARAAYNLQIVLSSAAATAVVSLVWLLITFLFGRIYCAVACPVGTFSDLFLRLRCRIPRINKPFRYRPRAPWSVHILWIYLLCVVTGIAAVPFVIEPWNMARNAASAVKPELVVSTWGSIGYGAILGAAAGIISLLVVALLSLWMGREFCTRICPLGTALGYVQRFSVMHLEINPDKCISCMRCEENCRAQCIQVKTRHIDENRCVRCFDCVADCPSGAIRYRMGRTRPTTPVMNNA